MKILRKFLYSGFVLFCLFFAHSAFAAVSFNEIAWMGTATSSGNEWIELYNNDSQSVDLSGWIIKTSDGKLNIKLSGSIVGNGFYLIERTDDATVPTVTADLVSTFGTGLSNSGENLTIVDSAGVTSDSLLFASGWPAGDNTTKQTMQKLGVGWTTAVATPKAATLGSTIPPDKTITDAPPPTNSAGSPQAVLPKIKNEPEVIKPATSISVNNPIIAGIAEPIKLTTTGYNKELIRSGRFVWSFSDGMSRDEIDYKPFSYAYKYPGQYVLSVSYYQNYYSTIPDAVDRIIVTVVPPEFSISKVGDASDPYIEILNNSKYEVNLSKWKIKGAIHEFTMPAGMIILPANKITFSPSATLFTFDDLSNIYLLNPTASIVAQYPLPEAPLAVATMAANDNYKPIAVQTKVRSSMAILPLSNSAFSDGVIDLTPLTASASSAAMAKNINLFPWLAFVAVIFIGVTSIVFIKNKSASPKELTDLSANDIKIIE